MRSAITSGPSAVNSSRPTLATPNHGRSSRASRRAATASSTSRARARRDRTASALDAPAAAAPLPGSVAPWSASGMGPTFQLVESLDTVVAAPVPQLGEDAGGRRGLGEGGGAHLDGVGAGGEELGGVPPAPHAAHPDDRRVRPGGPAVVDGPDGDRVQGRPG